MTIVCSGTKIFILKDIEKRGVLKVLCDVFVPGIVQSSGGIGAITSGDWRQLTKQVNFAPHARLSQITDESRPDSEVRRNVLFSLVVVFSGRLLVYCGSHQFVSALLVYRREIIWPGKDIHIWI